METRDPTTTARSDDLVGRVVAGKYRVVSMVAKGGMGRIYRAEQLPLGRVVALKVLHPGLGGHDGDPSFERRFLLEAATCARLKHQNTVTVFDYGQLDDGDGYFMVMELVEGRTLQRVLKEETRLAPARALRVAHEIARSLREAHDMGIVHRDLKPGNVMLVQTREGEEIKVLDFGIAKVLDGEGESITLDNRMVGSPRYMAPEQIQQRPVDGRADLYALGVVLYEMLAGKAPFQGAVPAQTLVAHLQKAVPPLPAALAVPPEVEALVGKLLEKEPENRFQTVDALLLALRTLDGSPDPSTAESARPERAGQRSAQAASDADPTLANPTLPRGNGRVVLLALGAALLLSLVLGAGAIGLVMLNAGAPPTQSVPEPAAALRVDEPPPPPQPVPLRIDSEPTAASVWEDGVELGQTPLTLRVDPGASDGRLFVLSLEGHEDLELRWEPGAPDPTAAMVPLPPAPVKRATPRVQKTSAPKPDLDILIER